MRKIWIVCISIMLAFSLCFGIIGCGDVAAEKATISVTVDGEAQKSGGKINAEVGTAFTIEATSSNKAAVSVTYVFGNDVKTVSDGAFLPEAAGNYVFTFKASGANDFKLTFNVTAGGDPATQYTVTFAKGDHAASDAQAPASRTVVSGTQITLPAELAAAGEYKFGGWSDGTTTHAANASYTVNGNVDFTAVWQANQYTVTFALGDHPATTAKAPESKTVDYGTDISMPTALDAAAGYVFYRWSDGTTEYKPGASYKVTKGATLTALYEEVTEETKVDVDYKLGDHPATTAKAPDTVNVKVGSSINLEAALDGAEGWEFEFWSDGSKTYNAGASYTVNGPVTFTAQWKKVAPIQNGNFESGDLTGWTKDGDAATIFDEATYWDDNQSFWYNGVTVQNHCKEGTYYLTTIDSETSVSVKSGNFTLGGDGIISFKLGAANSSDCYVALCDASNNSELIKITNDYFQDPELAQVQLRRFMYAYDYIGRSVYVKVVDNAAGNAAMAFVEFDDLQVNLTIAEAQTIVTADKAAYANYRQDVLNNGSDTVKGVVNAIRNYYSALVLRDIDAVTITKKITDKAESAGAKDITAYLTEAEGAMRGASSFTKSIVKINDGTTDVTTGFNSFTLAGGKTYTVTYKLTDPTSSKYAEATFKITVTSVNDILNGGFETGDLTGWTIVDGASKWGKNEDGSYKGVISAQQYWGEKLPYNQSGDYHLDGWDTGVPEADTWAIRSSVFTLGGSGWITVKMAGRTAAVKVYKADGTQIGLYKQTRFKNDDGDFPTVGKGSWADMATYAIDLSAYNGQDLYIELCDNETGGNWGHAFFDEVKTYYATAPDWEHNKDTVQQSNNGGNVDIPWVKATNTLN